MLSSSFFFTTSVFSGTTFFSARLFLGVARLFLRGHDSFLSARLFLFGTTFSFWHDSFFFGTTFSFRHDFFFLARLFFCRHDFFFSARLFFFGTTLFFSPRLLVLGTTFFTQHYRSLLSYRSFISSESSTWWPQDVWNVVFCYFCFWYHFPRARGFCLPTRHIWMLNVGILLNATFIWALAIVRSCCSWDHCMAVF